MNKFPPQRTMAPAGVPPSTGKAPQSVGQFNKADGPQQLKDAMKQREMRKKASSGPNMGGPSYMNR